MMRILIALLLVVASPALADDLDKAQSVCNENRDTRKFGVNRWNPGFENCAAVLEQFKAREESNAATFRNMRNKAKADERPDNGRSVVDDLVRSRKGAK